MDELFLKIETKRYTVPILFNNKNIITMYSIHHFIYYLLDKYNLDTLYIDMNLAEKGKPYGMVIEFKYNQIGKTNKWYRIDKPYGEQKPGNQKHMHGYICKKGKKGNKEQIFSINVDGTAHDGYHKTEIPEEFIPILKKEGFKIPKNNMIEFICVSPSYENAIFKANKNYFKKDEFILPVNKFFNIIEKSKEISFGITNMPLSEIYNRRICFDSFDNLDIVFISDSLEKAEKIMNALKASAKELDNYRSIYLHEYEDIHPKYETAAFIVYVVYK